MTMVLQHGSNEKPSILGPVGHRGRFFLKITKILNFPTYKLHICEDRDGRQATFYNIRNKSDDEIKENDCIAFTATIARYKHYKDTVSTYLNRCILIENKGST